MSCPSLAATCIGNTQLIQNGMAKDVLCVPLTHLLACAYIVTSNPSIQIQIIKLCVCVCVCVCVCARARVCVCVCVHIHIAVMIAQIENEYSSLNTNLAIRRILCLESTLRKCHKNSHNSADLVPNTEFHDLPSVAKAFRIYEHPHQSSCLS